MRYMVLVCVVLSLACEAKKENTVAAPAASPAPVQAAAPAAPLNKHITKEEARRLMEANTDITFPCNWNGEHLADVVVGDRIEFSKQTDAEASAVVEMKYANVRKPGNGECGGGPLPDKIVSFTHADDGWHISSVNIGKYHS